MIAAVFLIEFLLTDIGLLNTDSWRSSSLCAVTSFPALASSPSQSCKAQLYLMADGPRLGFRPAVTPPKAGKVELELLQDHG